MTWGLFLFALACVGTNPDRQSQRGAGADDSAVGEPAPEPAERGSSRQRVSRVVSENSQGVAGGIDQRFWAADGYDVFDAKEISQIFKLSPLPDPPADPTNAFEEREDAAHLGRFLFFDKRLSREGDVACSNCHVPEKFFADRRSVSVGRARTQRHAPALWNVAYNRWFFWDGRADSLWSQALAPLEHPDEHGANRTAIAHLVFGDVELRKAYEGIFGPMPAMGDVSRFPENARPALGDDDADLLWIAAWDAMAAEDRHAINRVFANLGKAVAAYERQILSRDAPFDGFVEGLRSGDQRKLREMSAGARRGLDLFIGSARCTLCHAGPNFTDREFHNTRVPPLSGGKPMDAGRYAGVELVRQDLFNGLGEFSDDRGRYAKDKVEYLVAGGHDWGEFKTPSLRNVSATAPYMHQGQLAQLSDVLSFYNTLEDAVVVHEHTETILVPLLLEETELKDLADFLHALTDVNLDPTLLKPPDSPLWEAMGR